MWVISKRSLAILATLAFVGCDFAYPSRVSGHFAPSTSAGDGWVVALGTGSSAKLDNEGRFTIRYERLNALPSSIPLLVVPQNGRAVVLEPGTDFPISKGRDEWVGKIELDLSHAKPTHSLPVKCVASDCSAILPSEAAECEDELVEIGPTGVSKPLSRRSNAHGHDEITFKASPNPIVVALSCGGPPHDDFVSDLIVASTGADASVLPNQGASRLSDGKCWTGADCGAGQACQPPPGPLGGEPKRGSCVDYTAPSRGPSHDACKTNSDCGQGEACVGVPCAVAPCPSYCTKL